jgi:hypothetical protein
VESNRFAKILESFSMKGKLQLLCSELNKTLYDQKDMMLCWMGDVEILWRKTHSEHTKSNHPWFNQTKWVKLESLTSNVVGAIDDALEDLNLENDREEQAQEGDQDDWLDDEKHQAKELNANESTNANADESTNKNAD